MVLHGNSHVRIYPRFYTRDQSTTADPLVKEVKNFIKGSTERELVVMGHGASLECISTIT